MPFEVPLPEVRASHRDGMARHRHLPRTGASWLPAVRKRRRNGADLGASAAPVEVIDGNAPVHQHRLLHQTLAEDLAAEIQIVLCPVRAQRDVMDPFHQRCHAQLVTSVARHTPRPPGRDHKAARGQESRSRADPQRFERTGIQEFGLKECPPSGGPGCGSEDDGRSPPGDGLRPIWSRRRTRRSDGRRAGSCTTSRSASRRRPARTSG